MTELTMAVKDSKNFELTVNNYKEVVLILFMREKVVVIKVFDAGTLFALKFDVLVMKDLDFIIDIRKML